MEEKQYFHIFNRGVDKRSIFMDETDAWRFMQSIEEFNVVEPIGSIFYQSIRKKKIDSSFRSLSPKLVEFVAYRLNQNHFHFILSPLVEKGIQKFMQKLSGGYTNYFNEKYNRSGSLFQGTYKKVLVESNEQLLHLSVYVNCNDRAHPGLNEEWLSSKFSSLPQYHGKKGRIVCDIGVVIKQFASNDEYCIYTESTLKDIIDRKQKEKELKIMLIE